MLLKAIFLRLATEEYSIVKDLPNCLYRIEQINNKIGSEHQNKPEEESNDREWMAKFLPTDKDIALEDREEYVRDSRKKLEELEDTILKNIIENSQARKQKIKAQTEQEGGGGE
jgi:hypothetical protein